MLAIWNFAHILTAAVYIAWCMTRFKGSNRKVCKMMMPHFGTVLGGKGLGYGLNLDDPSFGSQIHILQRQRQTYMYSVHTQAHTHTHTINHTHTHTHTKLTFPSKQHTLVASLAQTRWIDLCQPPQLQSSHLPGPQMSSGSRIPLWKQQDSCRELRYQNT